MNGLVLVIVLARIAYMLYFKSAYSNLVNGLGLVVALAGIALYK